MHESHRQAAEQHEWAAIAHRNAAKHYEIDDQATGDWHSSRAHECAVHAYALAREAQNKSPQIEEL